MEAAATEATTVGLLRLMNSEAPVVAVLLVLLIVLCWLAWKLYSKSEQLVNSRLTALEADLQNCNDAHKACERRTQRVAQAVVDAIKGNNHEAMARAQTVLEDSAD